MAVEFSDITREAHLRLSGAGLAFLDYVGNTPECLERGAFKLVTDCPFPDAKVQPWPTFASTALVEELSGAALLLEKLIKSIPRRFFGNDPERISRFYEIDQSHASLLIEIPDLLLSAMSRLDCILSPDGLKCLEMNSGSHLDAWFRSAMAGCQIRDPLIDRFLQSEGIGVRPVRTGPMAYAHLVTEMIRAGVVTDSTVNFGMVMPPGTAGYDGHISGPCNSREYQEALVELGNRHEGTCLTCSYTELAAGSAGGVMARGRTIHGLYELSPLPPRLLTGICRASLAGRILFFSGLATAVLSDKRNLVLLSDPANRHLFKPDEVDFIRRHVPWTRNVSEGSVMFEDSETRMVDLLLKRKDRFVLKRGKSTKKDDIFVGKFTQPEVWNHFVLKAVEEGCWIVQEYVENPPLNYQCGPVGSSPHELIYGCFCIGGRYGGTWLRMDTLGKRGVINASYGAQEAYLLELDDGRPHHSGTTPPGRQI